MPATGALAEIEMRNSAGGHYGAICGRAPREFAMRRPERRGPGLKPDQLIHHRPQREPWLQSEPVLH
jgi:hypothetical protein